VVEGLVVPKGTQEISHTPFVQKELGPTLPHGLSTRWDEFGKDLAQARKVYMSAFEDRECCEDGTIGAQGFLRDSDLAVATLFGAGSIEIEPDGLPGALQAHRVGLAIEGLGLGCRREDTGLLFEGEPERLLHAVVPDPQELLGLTNRRVFVDLYDEEKRPDGLTVEEQGGVWVALSNGGAVRRYTPDGVLDEVVEVRANKVTACTFGGPDLDQLFITTSQENIDPGTDPLAGSLFRAAVGVRGLPVREFAG
jgi:hypothetical protein